MFAVEEYSTKLHSGKAWVCEGAGMASEAKAEGGIKAELEFILSSATKESLMEIGGKSSEGGQSAEATALSKAARTPEPREVESTSAAG